MGRAAVGQGGGGRRGRGRDVGWGLRSRSVGFAAAVVVGVAAVVAGFAASDRMSFVIR